MPNPTKLAVRDDRWMRGEAEHQEFSRAGATLTFAAALMCCLFWAADVQGRPVHNSVGSPSLRGALFFQL